MSEIVDDLKVANVEVTSNLGLRLSGDEPEIKTTQTDAPLTVTAGSIDLDSNSVRIGNSNGSIGFFGKTPVVRPIEPTSHITAIGVTGSVNIVYRDTTFTGGLGVSDYTIGDIVRVLKDLGLITQ